MKVVSAMSGGVDSAVCAALLKQEGYDVVGITMKLWPKEECGYAQPRSCCSLEGIRDARYAAGVIGIPHYVISLYNEFKKEVIDNFIKEYSIGRTPNPCVPCNERIKFDALLRRAKALGARYIATGHYAIVEYRKDIKRYILKEGKDKSKDQSYFLFSLRQNQLRHILFPNGKYQKSEIRNMAKQIGLELLYNKKESQDICFTYGRYGDFLRKKAKLGLKPGDIVDKEGRFLGKHRGIFFYTIGQREGLGISSKVPLYVIKIDSSKNLIIVGTREDVYKKSLIVKEVNWLSIKQPLNKINAQIKIRYRHRKADAVIEPINSKKVRVIFNQPQQAPTPGQAAVFYQGELVLGGGWIDEVED